MRAQFINESHLRDINQDEILNRKFISRLFNNNYQYELYVEGFKNRFDITDLSDDEIIKLPKFKNWLDYVLSGKLEEIYYTLEEQIDTNGKIKIYRQLLVDENWISKLEKAKHLGIYWSFDKDAAEPHWGYNDSNKKVNVMIESSIDENYVDWNATLRLNIETEDEKEIRLFKNTPIKIDKIYVNDEEISNKFEFLKHKIYLT